VEHIVQCLLKSSLSNLNIFPVLSVNPYKVTRWGHSRWYHVSMLGLRFQNRYSKKMSRLLWGMSSMWGRNGRVLRRYLYRSKKYSLLGGVGLRKNFICFQPNRELTYTLRNLC